MKKQNYTRNLLGTIVVFMLAMLTTTSARAEEVVKYGFNVGGVEVTSENCKDLTCIEGVRCYGDGYIYYEPKSNRLTLRNAIIDSSPAIEITDKTDFDILVKGVCHFNLKEGIGIKIQHCNTTIKGTGRLDISGGFVGVFHQVGLLKIDHCILNVSGSNYAFYSPGGTGYSNLEINCADMNLSGGEGAMFNYDGVRIYDCKVKSDKSNVYFDTEKKTFVEDGASANNVTIQSEVYGIRIDHEYVTKAIVSDLTAISAVSGKASYSPSQKQLKLEYVTIESADEGIVNESVGDLSINVEGANTITTLEGSPLRIGARTTITSSTNAVLGVNTMDGNAIDIDKEAYLSIENCVLCAESESGCGIKGVKGTENLYINNSTVEAVGPSGSICNIRELVLIKSSIAQPSGAEFDNTLKGVAQNGEIVTDKVVIKSDYLGFDFCGKMVTKDNYDKLSSFTGVNGKVSYDPETKTLTFDNVTIESEELILKNKNDGLNIKLIGTNKMTSKKAIIYSLMGLNIFGQGTLDGKRSGGGPCINMCGQLKIEECTMNLRGSWGIQGDSYLVSFPPLIVRNANLTVESTVNEWAILNISSLTLEGCAITQPQGAAFDETLQRVALDGKSVKKVVIEVTGTNNIEGAAGNASLCRKGIYTMQGLKMEGEWENLPTGIYIVDGMKMIK